MHPQTANWLQMVLPQTNYANKDRIYEEFEEVLTQYNGLTPKFENQTRLLGLTGVIPVTYRNATYNIPIGIWFKFDYPTTPPDFVVMPTENMKIVVGKHVTAEGKITHPYLDSYRLKPQNSVVEFISILRKVFAADTPVVSVKAQAKPQTQPAYSMPQPVSMPMPRPNNFNNNNNNNTGYMPYNNYQYPSNISQQPTSMPYPVNSTPSPSHNSLPRQDPKIGVLKDVREKVNKDIESTNKELKKKIDDLLDESKKLSENEKKINNTIRIFEEEKLKIKGNIDLFQNKNREISEKVEQLKSKNEINPDDILELTPLMNQLVAVVAEESTIEDMIFYLGKALTSEQIDLNFYLKNIRNLSRELFLKKVLIKKIRAQAQLS